MDQTKDIVRQQYKNLPANLRSYISSDAIGKAFVEIMRRRKLRTDEMGALENEVAMILIGFEHPSALPENVKRHVGLPHDIAIRVSGDVNELIFAPVRSALRFMHEQTREKNRERQGAPNQERVTYSKEEAPYERKTPARIEPPGIERTMPRDIAEAKLKEAVHIPHEEKKLSNDILDRQKGYGTGDPYREPFE